MVTFSIEIVAEIWINRYRGYLNGMERGTIVDEYPAYPILDQDFNLNFYPKFVERQEAYRLGTFDPFTTIDCKVSTGGILDPVLPPIEPI